MNLGSTFLLPLPATVAHNNSLLPFCPFLSVDHPFVSFRSPPCFLSRSLSFILYCVFPSPGDPLPQAQLPPASISRCLPGSLLISLPPHPLAPPTHSQDEHAFQCGPGNVNTPCQALPMGRDLKPRGVTGQEWPRTPIPGLGGLSEEMTAKRSPGQQ